MVQVKAFSGDKVEEELNSIFNEGITVHSIQFDNGVAWLVYTKNTNKKEQKSEKNTSEEEKDSKES